VKQTAKTIELSKISRLQLYYNVHKYTEKQLDKILADSGGDIAFNGPIFLWSYKPCDHLKVDGIVKCKPIYTTYGMAWNTDLSFYGMQQLPCNKDNYVETTHLVVNGQKIDKPPYQPDMGGNAYRTAIGRKQGRFAYYVSQKKMTPEALRDLLYSYGWEEAMMLDGGGSTCYIDKDGLTFYSDAKRIIPYYIVVHLKPAAKSIEAAGLNLIKQFEGCRLKAYKPFSYEKYWTIGWGHYGADVKEGQTITQAEADALLVSDLAKYVAYVNNAAYVPITASLTQNQFDALVSFTYNCGSGCLKTLCKDRTVAQIAAKIPLYNKSGGKVITGLVRRRAAEQALFSSEVR